MRRRGGSVVTRSRESNSDDESSVFFAKIQIAVVTIEGTGHYVVGSSVERVDFVQGSVSYSFLHAVHGADTLARQEEVYRQQGETPGKQGRRAWRRPTLYTASLVALTDAVGVGYVCDHGPLQQERTQCALQPSARRNQCRSRRISSSR